MMEPLNAFGVVVGLDCLSVHPRCHVVVLISERAQLLGARGRFRARASTLGYDQGLAQEPASANRPQPPDPHAASTSNRPVEDRTCGSPV